MKIEKRSCYAEFHGAYFEVPPRTKWLTVDMRGFVFASEADEKPEPAKYSKLPIWEQGCGFYVGKIKLFRFDWEDMVFGVQGKLFTRDEYVSMQVRNALEYCAEKIKVSDSMGAAYCSQIVRMVAEQVVNKNYTQEHEE